MFLLQNLCHTKLIHSRYQLCIQRAVPGHGACREQHTRPTPTCLLAQNTGHGPQDAISVLCWLLFLSPPPKLIVSLLLIAPQRGLPIFRASSATHTLDGPQIQTCPSDSYHEHLSHLDTSNVSQAFNLHTKTQHCLSNVVPHFLKSVNGIHTTFSDLSSSPRSQPFTRSCGSYHLLSLKSVPSSQPPLALWQMSRTTYQLLAIH